MRFRLAAPIIVRGVFNLASHQCEWVFHEIAGGVRGCKPRGQPYGGRQLAQRSLQNSAGSGQHRDAVPLSSVSEVFNLAPTCVRHQQRMQRARLQTSPTFQKCGGARWEGSALIRRPRAGSIPAPATLSFPLRGHYFPKAFAISAFLSGATSSSALRKSAKE